MGWIVHRCLTEASFLVEIPRGKLDEVVKMLKGIIPRATVARREIRSLAGKLSYFAGLAPRLRAFVAPLWAVAAGDTTEARLPKALAHVRRIAPALRWLLAFLTGLQGPLRRLFALGHREVGRVLDVVTDACPWGMGAVLYEGSVPVAYWADALRPEDALAFDARLGDPAFNTLWEGLAVLVSLRLWAPSFGPYAKVTVRSDNLGFLQALAARRAGDSGLNRILQEVSLDECIHDYPLSALVHIPGIANAVADGLSRMWAPEPKALPLALASCPRSVVTVRSREFYRTLPCSAARVLALVDSHGRMAPACL